MFTTYMVLGTMISQADPVFTIGVGAVVAMTGLFALAFAAVLGATAELRGFTSAASRLAA